MTYVSYKPIDHLSQTVFMVKVLVDVFPMTKGTFGKGLLLLLILYSFHTCG